MFGTGEQIILVSGISGGRRYSPAYPGRVLWRCFLGSFDEERRAGCHDEGFVLEVLGLQNE